MPIPKNISKEYIEKAIEELRTHEIPSIRLSERYFLKIGEMEFPPKYTITLANKFANGDELPSENFTAIEAKAYLEKLGFIISDRKETKGVGYFQQLEQFLAQAKTQKLKYSNYDKEYLGLKVSVSFGKGNIARIPWISFLGKDQTTEKGIYPGYLYYKEYDELILAYCVSETKPAELKWKLSADTTRIKDYFKSQSKTPFRYGDSFVFKVYNLKNVLSQNQIEKDLNEIINVYKELLSNNVKQSNLELVLPKKPLSNFTTEKLDVSLFLKEITNSGILFDNQLIVRYTSALLTKPFVILTGLSGSGKTKLAQVFAKWICENESQYKLIPVGADWTNREPLLGYPNALEIGKYVLPENGVVNLILEAMKDENQNKPYFLILDEMNLSHVERYFADFLSAMESGEDIPLHHESDDWIDDVPAKVKLPKNLFIVGTVNIDETTYMFSPKVLDRANVIEFRVSETEMKKFLDNIQPLNLESII